MDSTDEDLTVSTGATATTSDKAVTVGCPLSYGGHAEIGLSTASGQAVAPRSLQVSESVSIETGERSYRVLLLSADHKAVCVRVSHSQRHQQEAAEAARPSLSILETRKSCLEELKRIILPKLSAEALIFRESSGRLELVRQVRTKSRFDFFSARTDEEWDKGYQSQVVISITHEVLGSPLFTDGHWHDLRIVAFESGFLENAKAIAQEYTLKTGSRVTIHKEF